MSTPLTHPADGWGTRENPGDTISIDSDYSRFTGTKLAPVFGMRYVYCGVNRPSSLFTAAAASLAEAFIKWFEMPAMCAPAENSGIPPKGKGIGRALLAQRI